jgi:hypothetical protein
MPAWEYRKIHLNDVSPRGDEIDLLNDAGKDGWEVVGITSNNTAYLKRPIEPEPRDEAPAPPVRVTRRRSATSAT